MSSDTLADTLEFPVRFNASGQPGMNPYWLRGKGKAAIHDGLLGLEGRKGFPFWFSGRKPVIVPFDDIFDVEVSDKTVSFKVEQQRADKRRTRYVRLLFDNIDWATDFADALPRRVSDETRRRRAEVSEFRQRFAQHAGPVVVLPLLVMLNVLAYLWIGTHGGGWFLSDWRKLIDYGSLYGPLASSGEWWRLVTATFLHGGIVHLAVNMFALWDTGRFAEQLFGRTRFFLLYLLAGVGGSAASLWWNPYVHSVGASGAVFGVFGAMLAFLLDRRNGVPVTIMQSHLISIVTFVVFSLFIGFSTTGIDNAAHLGGLTAGALLGWTLARPVGESAGLGSRLKAFGGVAATGATVAVLLSLVPNTRAPWDAHQRFTADLQWFVDYEKQLITSSKAALERMGLDPPPDAAFGRDLNGLSQRWGEAQRRLAGHKLDPRVTRPELIAQQQDVVTYLDLRKRAIFALSRAPGAAPKVQAQSAQEFDRLWKESNAVLQRINDRNKALSEPPRPRRR